MMKQLLGSIAIQLLAFAVVLASLFLGFFALNAVQAAIVISLLAAFLAWVFRLDRWWILIHCIFPLAVIFSLEQAIPPHWYLIGFVALVLFYSPAVRSRVPLFLSNVETVKAVDRVIAEYLPRSAVRVLDFGCGNGHVISRLAKMAPGNFFVGIEAAIIPFLIAKFRTWRQPNASVRFGNFWLVDLSGFDVIYAFLSSEPMPQLWEKARQEMREGGLLISNSFTVPGQTADEVVEVADSRKTLLHLYRF